MIDRIKFDGGVPDASDFRAPDMAQRSAYAEHNGFLEIDIPELRSLLAGAEHLEKVKLQDEWRNRNSGQDDFRPFVLWDVRPVEEYAVGHVPQADNVPLEWLNE